MTLMCCWTWETLSQRTTFLLQGTSPGAALQHVTWPAEGEWSHCCVAAALDLLPDVPETISASLPYCFDRMNPRDYNSYGSRRGNDAVMARGTFANIRLFNKFLNKQAPQTLHLPSGETVRFHHLAAKYLTPLENLKPNKSHFLGNHIKTNKFINQLTL